jgi:hypothetical protein
MRLGKQAYVCRDCGITTHKPCHVKVKNFSFCNFFYKFWAVSDPVTLDRNRQNWKGQTHRILKDTLIITARPCFKHQFVKLLTHFFALSEMSSCEIVPLKVSIVFLQHLVKKVGRDKQICNSKYGWAPECYLHVLCIQTSFNLADFCSINRDGW